MSALRFIAFFPVFGLLFLWWICFVIGVSYDLLFGKRRFWFTSSPPPPRDAFGNHRNWRKWYVNKWSALTPLSSGVCVTKEENPRLDLEMRNMTESCALCLTSAAWSSNQDLSTSRKITVQTIATRSPGSCHSNSPQSIFTYITFLTIPVPPMLWYFARVGNSSRVGTTTLGRGK